MRSVVPLQMLLRDAAMLGHRQYAAPAKQAAVKWSTMLFKAATERGAVRTNARKAPVGTRRHREGGHLAQGPPEYYQFESGR